MGGSETLVSGRVLGAARAAQSPRRESDRLGTGRTGSHRPPPFINREGGVADCGKPAMAIAVTLRFARSVRYARALDLDRAVRRRRRRPLPASNKSHNSL